ncbi:hypothetical protein [Cellulomonas sp. Leaf395]|uniref:hypothetical protein n=1 Tax=Cellulomonas sp. Leaf395 TaxID=1736362 RepID=UPI000AA381DA|nr:hypothetical protein [Cellulomonas sp. Leaf395]
MTDTETDTARAAAKRINDAFQSQGLFEPFWGRAPGWLGSTISRMLTLTGFDELPYLTCRGDEDDDENGQRSAIIVAFSASALVIAHVADARSNSAVVTVRAIPRRTLTGIESTESTTNLLSDNVSWNTWPGSYQLALHYSDGTDLTLPIGRYPKSEDMYAFESLRPSLLADLAAV